MTQSAAATAPNELVSDIRPTEDAFDLSAAFRIWRALKHQIEHEMRGESGAETKARIALLAQAQTRLIDLAAITTNRDARSIRLELEVWLKTPAAAAELVDRMSEQDMAAVEAALQLVENSPHQSERAPTD
ncbi:MAG: hypothetical protein RIE56_04850 [Amphiplicatus sp.]